MIASHHVGQNHLSAPNSSVPSVGGGASSKFQTPPPSVSAALAFSTLTGAQMLSQQPQHGGVPSGAVGVGNVVSSVGSNSGGGGFKPKREQVMEFFKMVKDGKINEVNQALKTNQQLALSHDEKQNNALYYAASLGDKQMSEILINAGADVNHVGDSGYTALMAAAEKGFSQCCDLYIKSSHATVNARNYNGNSALHLAATRGHHDVCRVLIESGAEISATNGKNLNAINEARAAQHYNLSDYLEQQMAQRMVPSQPSTNHSRFSPPLSSKTARISAQTTSDVSKNDYLSFPLVSKQSSETVTKTHTRPSNGHQSPFIGSEIGYPSANKLRPITPPESGDFGNPFLLDGIPTDSYISDSLVDKAPGGLVNGLEKTSESTSSSVGENLNRLHSYKLNLGLGASTSASSNNASIRNSTGSLIDSKASQMSHYPSCSSVLSSHTLSSNTLSTRSENLLNPSSGMPNSSRPSSMFGYPNNTNTQASGKQSQPRSSVSGILSTISPMNNAQNSQTSHAHSALNNIDVNNLRAALRAVAGGPMSMEGLHIGHPVPGSGMTSGTLPGLTGVNSGSSILDIYNSLESAHRQQQQTSTVLTAQNLLQVLSANPFATTLNDQAAVQLGLKQQQQLQMECLQYQLLINELSRKNRDLEFKLSEMETQFLTLQVENQRIRADNQKMSMRLRLSYP